MYLFARFVSVAILVGTSVSSQATCVFAQENEQSPSAMLPSAPIAQTATPSSQLSDQQSSGAPVSPADQSQKEPSGSQQAPTDNLPTSFLSGTVTTTDGNVVPGASVLLEGPQADDRRTVKADENGGFRFEGLKPGVPYHLTVESKDLESWKSAPIILDPGQYSYLKDIQLKVPDLVTSVTVYATQEQIATQQVEIETKQRVFGLIPNFYVTYDKNPVPLTTKLKFKLAFKADTDIMTFVGVAFMATIYQAGDIPNYGQGWDAYGKRVAAGYGDTTTDIFFGGAIYPWLFRQDPRYFYQGTGTTKSRVLHAISSPYICKGDNGKTQVNFSSMGGDLTSGAISNFYYPESNRGAGLLFEGFAITTGVRTVNGLIQEFLLRKLTPSARAAATGK